MATHVKHVLSVQFLITIYLCHVFVLSERPKDCPAMCTCRLEHITDTSVYRFMYAHRKLKDDMNSLSVNYNDVVYDEQVSDNTLFQLTPIIRSAICVLQGNVSSQLVMKQLSKSNIDALVLIYGFTNGDHIIYNSDIKKNFNRLISLELIGPKLSNVTHSKGKFIFHIDAILPDLKYLNLEHVDLQRNKSLSRTTPTTKNATSEYVQPLKNSQRTITLEQPLMSTSDNPVEFRKIFYKYTADELDEPENAHLFAGFDSLTLLRVSSCSIGLLHWTMFENLTQLQHLYLENNKIPYIPSFLLYGAPNLLTLSVAHNYILNIEITDLAGLLKLQYLDLSYNAFTQLSELSLPPFPKLELATFTNNPLTVIYPNTFEVLNTTRSLIFGNENTPLTLMPNAFEGLKSIRQLTIINVQMDSLHSWMFLHMKTLQRLSITGNITSIQFDAFMGVKKLSKLLLSACHLREISMDAFTGLYQLEILDLSKNDIATLPPGVFDHLPSIREIYLNGNRLTQLHANLFSNTRLKLMRLNDNPWHCTCDMSNWRPSIVNKVALTTLGECPNIAGRPDKGIGCLGVDQFVTKYVHDNRVSPKCRQPDHFNNWNVFYARRILKCKKKADDDSKSLSKITADKTTLSKKLKRHRNRKLKVHMLKSKHKQMSM